jgi:hypothetical protein
MSNELVLDQRIIWNKSRMKEIEQAKRMIIGFKRQGYEIQKSDGSLMEKFSPLLEEVIVKARKVAKSVMMILTEKGDERLVWDKDNGREAKQAKRKFLELLAEGYTAFSVDHVSEKNRKIKEFDIDAEEILMVPEIVKG